MCYSFEFPMYTCLLLYCMPVQNQSTKMARSTHNRMCLTKQKPPQPLNRRHNWTTTPPYSHASVKNSNFVGTARLERYDLNVPQYVHVLLTHNMAALVIIITAHLGQVIEIVFLVYPVVTYALTVLSWFNIRVWGVLAMVELSLKQLQQTKKRSCFCGS